MLLLSLPSPSRWHSSLKNSCNFLSILTSALARCSFSFKNKLPYLHFFFSSRTRSPISSFGPTSFPKKIKMPSIFLEACAHFNLFTLLEAWFWVGPRSENLNTKGQYIATNPVGPTEAIWVDHGSWNFDSQLHGLDGLTLDPTQPLLPVTKLEWSIGHIW